MNLVLANEIAVFKMNHELEAVDWIDSMLGSEEDSNEIELILSSALTQTQLRSQELNKTLSRSLQQVSQSSTHLSLQMNNIKSYATQLQHILQHTKAFDHVNNTPIDYISKLHEIKTQLSKRAESWRESSVWQLNVRNFNDKLQAGQLMEAAEYLSGLRKSLNVLEHTPDRIETIEALSNRLEQLMTPQLGAVLHSSQADFTFQQCVVVFQSLDKMDFLLEEWAKAQQAQIKEFWYAYDPLQAKSFALWLDIFYQKLLEALREDLESAGDLFRNILDTQDLVLVKRSIEPLFESFRDRLAQLLLLERQEAYGKTCQFASSVIDLIIQTRRANSTGRRGSLEDELEQLSDSTRSVWLSCVAPYADSFTNYNVLEYQFLMDKVQLPVLDQQQQAPADDDELFQDQMAENPLLSFSEQFERYGSELRLMIQQAHDRCVAFAYVGGFPNLLEALNDFIAQQAVLLTSTVEVVQPKPKDQPDWSVFHAGLTLLEVAGQLESVIDEEDSKLLVRLRQELTKLDSELKWVHLSLEQAITTTGLFRLHDDPKLKQQVMVLSEKLDQEVKLFSSSLIARHNWISSVQSIVFQSVFHPIRQLISPLNEMAVWSMTEMFTTDLPSLSHLPQDYITTAADMLLSVLPQLEPFAQSSGLSFAILASSRLEKHADLEWFPVASALGIPFAEFQSGTRRDAIEQTDSSSAYFIDLWTNVFGSACMGVLLSSTLQINNLTTTGIAQLEVDYHYFQNVLQALGIKIHPCFEFLTQLLSISLEDLKTAVQIHRNELAAPTTGITRRIELKFERVVAKKRGILVEYSDEL